MRAFPILLLFVPVAAVPQAVTAQAVVQPLPGTTDADRLAEQMRALGANPRDMTALVAAGELSLGLDDLSAAAALFARADRINSRNPRVKAGMGSILVRSERPGEALRYFAMADSFGIDAHRIASDRGFAYDLIGEQERAQREYRVALKSGSIDETDRDETLRRYALSLGISGREPQALEVLDPLLRKTDRGAWRARAFVLAMNGKEAEAARIATTMLPPGMAQGLQPFFDRLPSLPAIDRAFAVHFGEVHTSAERIADRGMAPALAPLGTEQGTLRTVAVAQAPPVPTPGRKAKPAKTRPATVQVAATTPAPAPAPASRVDAALPAPPSYADRPVEVARLDPLPQRTAPTRRPSATQLANAASLAGQAGSRQAAGGQVAAVPRAAPAQPVRTAIATPVPAPAKSAPATTPTPAVTRTAPRPVASAPAPTEVASPAPAPTEVVSSAPTVQLAAADITPAPQTKASRTSEDSILARIIAGLSIPASELDVAPPPRAIVRVAPPPFSAQQVVVEAKAKEARDLAARRLLAEKTLADRKLAEKKAATDKKALAAKKLADAKKLEETKQAAAEKKAARANPPRIWVQVAGGANEGDLAKAYAAVRAKAPTVFAGRQAWTTPLRATNRVLAGPFKTDAEARGFVNQLGRNGVSAFTFASDQGQVVTRLPGR